MRKQDQTIPEHAKPGEPLSKGLAWSLLLSLALHIALVAWPLAGSSSRTMRAAKSPPVSVQFSIPARDVRDQPSSVAPETPDSIPSTSDSPVTALFPDSLGDGARIERPKLLFVDEINLDGLADLTNEGFVELELLISPTGQVVRAELLNANIPNEFFARVEATFRNAEFVPGRVNGIPSIAKYRFKVVFGPSSPH